MFVESRRGLIGNLLGSRRAKRVCPSDLEENLEGFGLLYFSMGAGRGTV
jgi:hypothetical protein